MFIDAHAHLDMYSDADLESVLDEIQASRVLTMSVSVDPRSFQRAEEIAARCSLVIPCFGIHPEKALEEVTALGAVGSLAERAPMIGEVGLDQRWVTDPASYGPQRTVFDRMLELASSQDKVVNVHCSGAEREALDMMVSHGIDRAIIHWYSGPMDVLEDMLAAGYFQTVGVEVLHSELIRRVAAAIPDHLLLTETDNPGGLEWLTGEVGRPAHLDGVIAELARLRGSSVGEVVALTRANLARLYEGDPHLAQWAALLSSEGDPS